MTTAIPEDLRAAFADRYALDDVLGRGGMATVYLARDRKHHRQVAVKVLRPGLAASLGVERFLKEIEIAARLTHPHILALHDSGEVGGFLYYVMPHIGGGSLRARLERERRLGIPAMLAVAGPVASALTYAHRMGVLHRDIKPENILFAEGLPVVADFGIAKAVSTAGGEQLTRTGFPLGTPGYMSPEQAAGLTDLDAQSDVYALAVVCYEMLVGAVPGRWPTEDAVRTRRFLEAPAAHRTMLDALPAPVQSELVHAMAIRQDQRTGTPEALLAELNGAPPAPPPAARDATATALSERRRFSDGEVQEIMRRAAEMDAAQPTMSGALTIGGLQQAAAEAGIDPAMVRQAAGQLASPVPPVEDHRAPVRPFSAAWFAGGPVRIAVERVVSGELSQADCAYLIEEVRTSVGSIGIVSTLGKTVSWVTQRAAGSGLGRDVQLTITMRGGMTRISIREGLGAMAGGIFGGIGGGVGGGGLGPVSAALASAHILTGAAFALFVPLWLAGVYATTRSVYHYSSKRRVRQIEELADRLAAVATTLIAEAALPPGSPERLLRS